MKSQDENLPNQSLIDDHDLWGSSDPEDSSITHQQDHHPNQPESDKDHENEHENEIGNKSMLNDNEDELNDHGDDNDPTNDLLNLSPIDDQIDPSTTSDFTQTIPKKLPPPSFQTAFSQSRLQPQPNISTFHQAFNSHSSNLFPIVSNSIDSSNNSIKPFNLKKNLNLNPSLNLSSSHSHSQSNLNQFEDSSNKFFESLVNSSSSSSSSNLSIHSNSFFDPTNHSNLISSNQNLNQTQTINQKRNSLNQISNSSNSNSNDSLSPSTPNPSSSNQNQSTSLKNSSFNLCLPPRPPKLKDDPRYASTPYNSPTGSASSTPVLPSLSLSKSNQNEPFNKPITSLSSKRRKIHSNQSISQFVPSKPQLDQFTQWKRIQELRSQRDRSKSFSVTSAQELDQLENQWSQKLQQSGTLTEALKLKQVLENQIKTLKKMKDNLGEELVRVQIEESVLRNFRGIIADRQANQENWN
ncbi:hypothetical protein O181_026670 [Austropuccinia psidii MF-1]|uniref:Uncharacterized protein n=1 Tax=Austropuccinia psidii MF-1 TaxID=1389203 RepID=A0A9Q3H2E6_9BASI|nr:hypothetical protein [Austropuccinia psidii MF-1]